MLEDHHYEHLDIFAVVEQFTSTKLHPMGSGKQANGACPYSDCSADDDGFIVWRELSTRNCHYHCRVCRRSGDVVRLVQEVSGWDFKATCKALDIKYWIKSDGSAKYTPKAISQPAPIGAVWQQKELAFLRYLYPAITTGLGKARARAYLTARGIPFELAYECRLGYIPPFAAMNSSAIGTVKVTLGGEEVELTQQEKESFLKRWEDRIIFPLHSLENPRFIGRALKLWQVGMTEQEHRTLIDERNVPIKAYNKAITEENKKLPSAKQKRMKPTLEPYLKTYPAGYFHAEVLRTCDHITVVEGPFDALALLAGGVLDVVTTAGTNLDASLIPIRICDLTLAYDADSAGKEAANKLRRDLRRKGITPRVRMPPDDGKGKDWSERYRLHGREGLAPLFAALPDICLLCGAPSWVVTDENKAYCKACWRKLGNEPAPGERCCECEDFVDEVDDELRPFCKVCWAKRPSVT